MTPEDNNEVTELISSLPTAQIRQDSASLIELMEKITRCTPQLWTGKIIGFDRYHYRYESGREGESFSLGFAPRKDRLVIYCMEGVLENSELVAHLGKHSTGKSCLYIKRLSDIDLGILEQLLTNSYTSAQSQ